MSLNAAAFTIRAKARRRMNDVDARLLDLGWSLAALETADAHFERANILMGQHKTPRALADFLAARRLGDPKSKMVEQATEAVKPYVSRCESCGGDGQVQRTETCPECGGSGSHALGRQSQGRGKIGTAGLRNNCMRCNGSGSVSVRAICETCRGNGLVLSR